MAKKEPLTPEQKRIDKLEEYVSKLIKTNTQLMSQVSLLTRESKRLSARITNQEASIKKINNTLHK